MLTVITNPADHNFSRSPVICEVETDNYIQNENLGLHALGIFSITGSGAVGYYIKIISAAITLQLDFINSIVPTVGKIRVKVPADSFTTYWNKVLSDIQLNTGLTALYTVTQDGLGGFFFLAILPGNTYSLTTSFINGLGLYFYNNTIGTDDIVIGPRVNYKIGIDVYVERVMSWPVGVFDKICSFEKEPINNIIKMDLSKFIDTQLDYYFPTPNQSASNHCRQTSKHFQIGLREIYGSPAAEHITLAAPDVALAYPGAPYTFEAIILKAGFSPRWSRIQPTNQLAAYIWSYPLTLTVFPSIKKIKLFQPEYLFYCFGANCGNPILKVTTYYADGTTVDAYQSLYSGTMFTGFVGCFPVNFSGSIIYYEMLNGDAVKFTAGIYSDLDHSTLIAGGGTYIPDYDDLGDDKIFMFTNSMSGVDTFRSVGHFIKDTEFSNESSSRMYYTSDLPHLGTEDKSQFLKTNLFKVHSGWLTKEEIVCMEEILLSKHVVEVEGLIYHHPITITSRKITVHETNEFLSRIEFEYYHQYKSQVTDTLAAAL